mgnify:CR=1
MIFKNGQGMPTETIIIILLAILVFVIVLVIFLTQGGDISKGFSGIIKSVINISKSTKIG